MNILASLLTASVLLTAAPRALSEFEGAQPEALVSVERHQSQPYSLIHQVEDDTWHIDSTLVDIYTRDLQAAGVLAMASLHRDGAGEVDGFVLEQVLEGSPLHQAGFQSGDIVHSVEDRPLGGPIRALMVMRALHQAEAVDVELSRSGERLEQHYLVPR